MRAPCPRVALLSTQMHHVVVGAPGKVHAPRPANPHHPKRGGSLLYVFGADDANFILPIADFEAVWGHYEPTFCAPERTRGSPWSWNFLEGGTIPSLYPDVFREMLKNLREELIMAWADDASWRPSG